MRKTITVINCGTSKMNDYIKIILWILQIRTNFVSGFWKSIGDVIFEVMFPLFT